MFLYSIYDRVAEEFGPLFEARTDAVAIRAYKGLLADKRPEEFFLKKFGSFDRDEGELQVLDYPHQVEVDWTTERLIDE